MALEPKQSESLDLGNPPSTINQTKVNSSLKSKPTLVHKKTDYNTSDRACAERHSIKPKLQPSEVATSKTLDIDRHQPSKIFMSKCRTELQALLDSIKTSYHDEIKILYGDEQYADLFIEIGEDALKPLHKCIVASRAFKFYSVLRGFKTSDNNTEQDIVVSEIQRDKAQPKDPADSQSATDKSDDCKQIILREALEPFKCRLPSTLLNCACLLSFLRRTYLDQEISAEETELYNSVLIWLKLNRPDLVRSTSKHSPDHRESFRTIQPDIAALSLAEEIPNMSGTERSTSNISTISLNDVDSNIDDDSERNSQAASVKDESISSSQLTRTETFEMISRKNPDSPCLDMDAGAADSSETTSTSLQPTTNNTTELKEPYAPTTRTGLKPKKFTTPVNIRMAQKSKLTETSNTSREVSREKTESPISSSSVRKTSGPTKATTETSKNSTKRPTVVRKLSNSSKSTPESEKSNSQASSGTKPKPVIITRAHPISIERSQSPSPVLASKGTKNFIATNKRLISQMERKTPSSQVDQAEDDECQSGPVEPSLIESLTVDTLAAQIDKFTLVSYSKLAEALSRMFIDEILTDLVITVKDEKRINAHKCILAARSPYLNNAINEKLLPATSQDSASLLQPLKIDLSEFTYGVTYFSIMHIYSGAVNVPEDVEIDELTKLSHLLHVSSLRQVCIHHLRMKYCHYFHKPCNVCCLGVLKTLPLAWRYDYTELYAKCLQWIGSHFVSIFCLEEFSQLKPHDLIEECYNATLSQLTPDNIISKTIECQKLLKSLPRVKWTESIICLVGRQLEDFCHYVADNYEKILKSEAFLNLGKSCWECEVLEENLLAAMNHLRPDSGCKTLIQLDKIESSIETFGEEPRNVSESFANLISKMLKYCERYLLKEAPAVVHCASWRQMNSALQKKIKDQAVLATDFEEPTKQLGSKPKLPSMSRHQRSSPSPATSVEGTRSPTSRSTPDSRLKTPNTTYLPPPKNKPTAARHVKVLK